MDVYLNSRIALSLGIRDISFSLLSVPGTAHFVTQSAKLAMLGIPCMFSGRECVTGANHSEIHRGPKEAFLKCHSGCFIAGPDK